jgi:hypothetical protein
MNLDQQLRTALSEEADMHNAPAPDVNKLIRGGKIRQRRRRRARFVRGGVAAALAVLVAGGVYGVTKTDPGTTNESGPTTHTPSTSTPTTTTSPPAYPDNEPSILPGTYRMYVGANDATGVPVNADLTFSSADWQDSNYPVLRDEGRYGAVAVYQPIALGAGTGCLTDKVNDNLGDTPQSLAKQLEHLPQSTVLQPPTSVQKFGQDAVHLQLRITPHCGPGVYRVAMTLRSGHGVSYGPIPKPVIIDFWAMTVGGLRVVVDSWHQVGAPSQMIDQIAKTRDSILFVTGG